MKKNIKFIGIIINRRGNCRLNLGIRPNLNKKVFHVSVKVQNNMFNCIRLPRPMKKKNMVSWAYLFKFMSSSFFYLIFERVVVRNIAEVDDIKSTKIIASSVLILPVRVP